MEIALIDHYDSFTHNVIDWLSGLGNSYKVNHIAFDDKSSMARVKERKLPLVISPGPKRPEDVSPTIDLVRSSLGEVPILGICLGHQILATVAGANIVHCKDPRHGEKRTIKIKEHDGFFKGIKCDFQAAVYNSLTVDPSCLNPGWRVTATCAEEEVQAIEFRREGSAPAVGLQFHPESFLSEKENDLLQSWRSMISK